MTQLDLLAGLDAREVALQRAAEAGGSDFLEAAREFITEYLMLHGPASGETVTDAAKKAGLRPADDRLYSPAYASLSRRGVIRKHSYCSRVKGNRTAGGIVWEIAD